MFQNVLDLPTPHSNPKQFLEHSLVLHLCLISHAITPSSFAAVTHRLWYTAGIIHTLHYHKILPVYALSLLIFPEHSMCSTYKGIERPPRVSLEIFRRTVWLVV